LFERALVHPRQHAQAVLGRGTQELRKLLVKMHQVRVQRGKR
jgi:hypothetical protein